MVPPTRRRPLQHPQHRHRLVLSSSSSSSDSNAAAPAVVPIVDQVTQQMKVSMKAKDTTTLATIRLIRSAFANAAIELQVPQLNDEQVNSYDCCCCWYCYYGCCVVEVDGSSNIAYVVYVVLATSFIDRKSLTYFSFLICYHSFLSFPRFSFYISSFCHAIVNQYYFSFIISLSHNNHYYIRSV